MKRTVKLILVGLVLLLIGFLFFFPKYTARLSDTSLTASDFAVIAKANKIFIEKVIDSTGHYKGVPDNVAWFSEATDFDQGFEYLSEQDRQSLKEMFIRKIVSKIDLFDSKDCISYELRHAEFHDVLNNGYEVLYIRYVRQHDCPCAEEVSPKDGISYPGGKGWFKVIGVNPLKFWMGC